MRQPGNVLHLDCHAILASSCCLTIHCTSQCYMQTPNTILSNTFLALLCITEYDSGRHYDVTTGKDIWPAASIKHWHYQAELLLVNTTHTDCCVSSLTNGILAKIMTIITDCLKFWPTPHSAAIADTSRIQHSFNIYNTTYPKVWLQTFSHLCRL